MARMPASIEADAARAIAERAHGFGEWIETHLHHHETSAAQAAAAATTKGTTTMSLFSAAHEIVAEAEAIGEQLLTHAKTIAANPATAPAVEWLATLAGLNIDPAIITKALGSIEALHMAYAPLVAQQAQAAAEAAAAEAAAQQQAA